jgi:hypothetical protein
LTKKKIKLFIHPCFPKTGSTFFQQNILPRAKNIVSLRKPNIKKFFEFNQLFKKIFIENFSIKTDFENKIYSDLSIKKKFINLFYDIIKNEEKNIFVLSDEDSFGLIGLNGFRNIYVFKDLGNELKKKDILVDIKFILTIRNQANLILSSYAYNNFYWNKKWKKFEDFKTSIFKDEELRSIFNYYAIYNEIYEIFNTKPIILPLELIEKGKKERIDYINIINKNFNSDIEYNDIDFEHKPKKNSFDQKKKKYFFLRYDNQFTKNVYYKLQKIHLYFKKISFYKKNFHLLKPLVNNFLKFLEKKIKKPQSKKLFIYFNDEEVKSIKNIYFYDNKKLAELSDLNLEKLDYY